MTNQKYSLNDLIKVIWKNIIVIIIFAIIGGGMFFMFAKHKQKITYTAERSIMISHNLNSKKSVSQVNADLAMIPTYEDMIKGRQIADSTWHMLPKNIKKGASVNDLSDSIDTNSRPNSLIINLKATTQNDEKSVAFVNYTADAVKKELPKMQQGIGTVHIYEKASKKNVTTQVHSSVKKYTLVGIALGIVAGMVISFVATSWKHIA